MVLIEAKVIDATHLELSRPIAAAQGGTVSVAVSEPGEQDGDREQWLVASAGALARAYGPAEPDYAPSMIREPNREYRP